MTVSASERARLEKLWLHEQVLFSAGLDPVAGVDEAGTGALMGPVAAGAVILPRGLLLEGLDDSKKLTEPQRNALAEEIKAVALAWCVGWAEVEEIDRLGIDVAGLLAMRRAIEGLSLEPAAILVDGNRRVTPVKPRQRLLIKGDSLSASIAAASILAKTARDAQVSALDAQFPAYQFALHKGYDTPVHREALNRLGPTKVHRRFAPVLDAAAGGSRQTSLF